MQVKLWCLTNRFLGYVYGTQFGIPRPYHTPMVWCHRYGQVFQSLTLDHLHFLAGSANDPSCLQAFLNDTLRLLDTNTMLFTLVVSRRRITLHAVVTECTLQFQHSSGYKFYYTQLSLLDKYLSTMSGHGKGGANHHCKICCGNIQG